MVSTRRDRIKVQTARMLEVYALLKNEIQVKNELSLTPNQHANLQIAIDTIATNMHQLEAELDPSPADNSTFLPDETVSELDTIVDAVLKWQTTNKNGE